MKIAPIIRAIQARDSIDFRLVHTGQHYDRAMNDVFFDELGIPEPDISLGCGGGTHGEQTAAIMVAFEKELSAHRADWVLVVGDVNSTLACSIVAKKLQVPVAHVEAGLRSFDRSMPEEINRLVTDAIADLFFVTEPSGQEHLLSEGHAADKIHYVGHVMIDNLFHQVEKLEEVTADAFPSEVLKQQLLQAGKGYGVVTMHRPANVDNENSLRAIVGALQTVARKLPLIFPVHPRTQANLDKFEISLGEDIHPLGPLPYMEFLRLWKDADIVLTDSGGLQEETTALGVRCITMRESTERPATVTDGTNIVAGTEPGKIVELSLNALDKQPSQKRPKYWDGKAAVRTVDVLLGLQPKNRR